MLCTIPALPKNSITRRLLRPSGRVLGTKRNNEIIVDGKKITIDNYYKQKIKTGNKNKLPNKHNSKQRRITNKED